MTQKTDESKSKQKFNPETGPFSEFLQPGKKVRPKLESFKIILVYFALGTLWIIISDNFMMDSFKADPDVVRVSTYKGLAYVFVTGCFFFLIINSKMQLFKSAIDRVVMLAYYDPLTKLPNRFLLEHITRERISSAAKNKQRLAFLCLDVDDFKHINNTMGHDAGEKYISYMSAILVEEISKPNIVARLGGDEFAILYCTMENPDSLNETIRSIRDIFKNPWTYKGNEFFITASIGVAIWPDHGDNFSSLLQNADAAMFRAKEKGKKDYQIFEPDILEKTWKFINTNNQLRSAIETNQFVLHYQPQFETGNQKIIGVEALIRWDHPKKGIILPGRFMPFVEKNNWIDPVEKWVLEEAFIQKKQLEEAGYDFKLSINLSGSRLLQEKVFTDIANLIETYPINIRNIVVEVTETAIIPDPEQAVKVLNMLKGLGMSFALDDFGTGYSSLTYLSQLPIDILKLDNKFICDITQEEKKNCIFKCIVELAHHLGLKVIVEGVETHEQLSYINRYNCDYAQGYLWAKPMPAFELEPYLADKKIRS